jgi:hypothetical protein
MLSRTLIAFLSCQGVTWSQPLLLSSWIAPWKTIDMHWQIWQELEVTHVPVHCVQTLRLKHEYQQTFLYKKIKALHTAVYKLVISCIRTTPLWCAKYLYIGKAAWFWFMFKLETDDWPVSCFRCLFSEDLRAILDKEWNGKITCWM